jgi:hypothetical protein
MTKHRSALFPSAVLAALMISGNVLLPTVAVAQDRHGAIAFSKSSGAHGWSYDYPTRSSSERAALDKCGSDDCKVVTWFRNACGALAVGEGNAYGATWGNSRQAALTRAMRACNSVAEGCKSVRWVCTGH